MKLTLYPVLVCCIYFEILQLILTACKWIYFDNPILLLGLFYLQFSLDL